METVELKACPFCGSAAEMVGDTTTLIRCTNEECISLPAPYNNYGHRADAITAWNTRFEVSLPPSAPDWDAVVASLRGLFVRGPIIDDPTRQEVVWNEAIDAAIAVVQSALALPPSGMAEAVREWCAKVEQDTALEKLEKHFRELERIASGTLECNADDVRKLRETADYISQYRKEQADVYG